MRARAKADPNCGGCQGLGSHRRWCPAVVGTTASIYGGWAQQAEAIGDACGIPEAANNLWSAAGYLRERAEAETGKFLQQQDEQSSDEPDA